MKKGGILFLDIETAPNLAYVWGMYEQNVIDYKSQWYIMCFSAKWKDGQHFTKGLPDYKGYKKDENDRSLVKELWDLLNEADVIVAQNGDAFDLRKINARFAYYKMPPPSPYKTVDTLKIARKHFAFNSNKLDHLGQYLGLGRKLEHEGFPLWLRCMKGDKKAWKRMKAYNRQDIILLEKVYFHLLPWMKNHPNMNMYSKKTICPKCGSSKGFIRGGFYTNSTTKYQVFRCHNCRGQARTTLNLRETKPLIGI